MEVPSISVIVRQAIPIHSLFQNIGLPGRGKKGLFFCGGKTVHILFPSPASGTGDTGRATQERPEARRIRSFETRRAGRGLGSPRAGRRVERPPGWALGGPPARAWPALTSRSGGPGSRLQPSPARAPPDPGPRPRRRRRASSPRAGARPACQLGGRPAVAAAAPFLLCLSFLQPTPRPPRAEPVPALQGPHAASARPATPAQSPLRGGLCRGAASGQEPRSRA